MKNFRNLLHRTLAALLVFLAGACMAACYDSGFGSPGKTENAGPVSETIANIRSRYLGVPFAITSDISVRGTVTSSDAAENFYRTICIEENSAALEIMAGIDRLHNDFPIGCRVALHLKGLTVAESRGVLQVGNAPAPGSGYDTDYIGSKAELASSKPATADGIHLPSCSDRVKRPSCEHPIISPWTNGFFMIFQIPLTPSILTALSPSMEKSP